MPKQSRRLQLRRKELRQQPPSIAPVVLRKRDACAFVALKPTQFSKYVKLGHLPQPVKLTDDGRAVAWIKTELEAWLAERIAKRDARP